MTIVARSLVLLVVVTLCVFVEGHFVPDNPAAPRLQPLMGGASASTGGRFMLPDQRAIDPDIFGTPAAPLGTDPGSGLPLSDRLTTGGVPSQQQYTVTKSKWWVSQNSSISMPTAQFQLLVWDWDAFDGVSTRDMMNITASWPHPSLNGSIMSCVGGGRFSASPKGLSYTHFAGVATEVITHGMTNIGERLLPTMYSAIAGWGRVDVYMDGQLLAGASDRAFEIFVGQAIRDANHSLLFDGGLPAYSSKLCAFFHISPIRLLGSSMSPLSSPWDYDYTAPGDVAPMDFVHMYWDHLDSLWVTPIVNESDTTVNCTSGAPSHGRSGALLWLAMSVLTLSLCSHVW